MDAPTTDWHSHSATELCRLVATGEASALELVAAHLSRIDGTNDDLNAVVALRAEQALDEARAADACFTGGELTGPLHGLPFTVKDWIETAGLPGPSGFEARRAHVPSRDATVVARMRAAGAILLGKTKAGTDDLVHPHPRNPYRQDRTTGASSAGEAAVIAAGCSPAGLGSDSGGSIRWPAHCCGIAALRPTVGRVPLTGHFPRIGPMQDPRTVIGPMARRVGDLQLLLETIAGIDHRDASVVPVPLGHPGDVDAVGLRVAVHRDVPGAEASVATAQAVDRAAAALQEAGAIVEEATPPRLDEALPLTVLYWQRSRATGWHSWDPQSPSRLSADTIERMLFEWDRFRRSMVVFMERFDLLVCPVAAEAAPPYRPDVPVETWSYTVPYSLTGQPVAVCRVGSDPDGLPLGVQFVARAFEDHVALAAAAVVELASGGYTAPGNMAPDQIVPIRTVPTGAEAG